MKGFIIFKFPSTVLFDTTGESLPYVLEVKVCFMCSIALAKIFPQIENRYLLQPCFIAFGINFIFDFKLFSYIGGMTNVRRKKIFLWVKDRLSIYEKKCNACARFWNLLFSGQKSLPAAYKLKAISGITTSHYVSTIFLFFTDFLSTLCPTVCSVR